MATLVETRAQVQASLERAPVIGVVRTPSTEEAAEQARTLAAAGLALVEITFTVPQAAALTMRLRRERGASPAGEPAPWIGMGTVTTPARAEQAIAAGAEFLVTPNVNLEVARLARHAGLFLVMGALTPSEIVAAHEAGADLVKVYPLPPVGGPAYLATVRQPLGDIPMLAAGGFGVDEIPAYRQAGASAFGIGYSLLAAAAPGASGGVGASVGVGRALRLARGEQA
jgi:2-dehydro-3-deoxyphosphogluconate aldolase/(4S)-4-hydroxy-2-oxoglutarate aldolase